MALASQTFLFEENVWDKAEEIGKNFGKDEHKNINEFYKKIAIDKDLQNKILHSINLYTHFNKFYDISTKNEIINSCILTAIENNCRTENEFWNIIIKNKHAIAKTFNNSYEIYASEFIDSDHNCLSTDCNEYKKIEDEIDSELLPEENKEQTTEHILQYMHSIDMYDKLTQRQAEILKCVIEFLDECDRIGKTKKPTQKAIAKYVSEKTGKNITRQSLNLIIIRLVANINEKLLGLVGTKGEYAKHIAKTLNKLVKTKKTGKIIDIQVALEEIKKTKEQKPLLYANTKVKTLNFGDYISQQAYEYYQTLKNLVDNKIKTADRIKNSDNNNNVSGLLADKPETGAVIATKTAISNKAGNSLNIIKLAQNIKQKNTKNNSGKTANSSKSNNNKNSTLLLFKNKTTSVATYPTHTYFSINKNKTVLADTS